MEFQWIGHAGALIRNGDAMVAIDPFLSGKFYWGGEQEKYLGNSPWIGTSEKKRDFIAAFGKKLSAILITHAHGDHFEQESIIELLNYNPDIELIMPYPVVNWMKNCGGLNNAINSFLAPVRWDEIIEIDGNNDSLEIGIMPNPGIKKENTPARVGYYIGNSSEKGIVHLGDAHGIGDWGRFKSKTSSIVLWGVKERREIIDYFPKEILEKVFWIHWEDFKPGNFLCSLDPTDLFINNQRPNSNIENIIPQYEYWYQI
jgi:L-ascorbate metabolism protein UlaG (beta-lactamase superfamily)